MIRQVGITLVAATLALLSACTTAPTIKTGTGGPGASLADISHWAFHGRVSITRGDEGWHAGLQWLEQAGQYELKVAGPLGQGAFEMQGGPDAVVLEDASGQVFSARDADSLVIQVTGWELPVAGLRYWVRGLAVPGVEASLQRDTLGRVTSLRQSGWIIVYDRFQDVAGLDWPGRLKLARGDISVRLVIDQWRTGLDASVTP